MPNMQNKRKEKKRKSDGIVDTLQASLTLLDATKRKIIRMM